MGLKWYEKPQGVRVWVFGRSKWSVHYVNMSLYQFIPYYASACMHTHMHAHTHAHTHSCTHTRTQTHTHAHTHSHTHTHTQRHTYTRTHIYTHTLIPFKERKPTGLKVDIALLFSLCYPLRELKHPTWTCPTTFGPILQSTKHGQRPVIHCEDLCYSA